ncbi:phosphatidylserine decarboxylase [Henriciella marina]|uniref:phosphatidylserine decarboxylase n=1 Tax=Henriciella marina TaxID=453851 RepID=UPI000369A6E1|nr:phosphatidylserine decarboxylase [Henriciella marina]
MADRDTSLSHKTFPWFRSGFDLEGVVGFLAAWLLGVLLAMIWEPLFWVAFIPGVIILFATRTAERVTPQSEDHLVSPCDGVVVSVVETDAPASLRMAGPALRIRISSSPLAANNIHAPIAGAIDRIDRTEGDPKAFAAMKAEGEGLERLSMVFSSDVMRAGFVVATGGLGPRLEVKSDAGDRVLKGKTVATRRLGGWCDIYVPARSPGAPVVEPGRTLVGGETILWDLHMSSPEVQHAPEDQAAATTSTIAEPPVESGSQAAAAMSTAPAAAAVTPDPMPPEVISGEEDDGAGDDNAYIGTSPVEQQPTPEVVPPTVEEEVETDVQPAPDASDAQAIPETLPPEIAEEEAETPYPQEPSSTTAEPESGISDPSDPSRPDQAAEATDPASMFERLRQQARKLAGDDDNNNR